MTHCKRRLAAVAVTLLIVLSPHHDAVRPVASLRPAALLSLGHGALVIRLGA